MSGLGAVQFTGSFRALVAFVMTIRHLPSGALVAGKRLAGSRCAG